MGRSACQTVLSYVRFAVWDVGVVMLIKKTGIAALISLSGRGADVTGRLVV